MSHKKLTEIIDEEIKNFFESNDYSLEDELILTNEIWLGELLNPNDSYKYYGRKGFFKYKDLNGVEFFAILVYQPTKNPYFELKTGWIDDNGNPKYEPSIPPVSPKASSMDWDKRSNTVAKIYRDELLPFFKSQKLSDKIIIKPISNSRMKFAERLVKKFTDKKQFKIEYKTKEIRIIKL